MATEAELYDELRPVVEKTANRFAKKFRADRAECRSLANEVFVHAVRGYDPAGGSLGRRLNYLVWNRLLDAWRRTRTREKNVPTVRVTAAAVARAGYRPPEPFDRDGFARNLTPAARALVSLVLDDPRLEAEVRAAPPRELAAAVRRYARRTLGWTRDRVRETFAEIAHVLTRG